MAKAEALQRERHHESLTKPAAKPGGNWVWRSSKTKKDRRLTTPRRHTHFGKVVQNIAKMTPAQTRLAYQALMRKPASKKNPAKKPPSKTPPSKKPPSKKAPSKKVLTASSIARQKAAAVKAAKTEANAAKETAKKALQDVKSKL